LERAGIRKNLIFLQLYAYRVSSPVPDPSYAQLIGPEVAQFYRGSSKTFEELGNTVFKNVYGDVELLQTYFAHASSYPLSQLRSLYTKIGVSLRAACDRLLTLDQTVFDPAFQSEISSAQQL
jgi:hypothetical protein